MWVFIIAQGIWKDVCTFATGGKYFSVKRKEKVMIFSCAFYKLSWHIECIHPCQLSVIMKEQASEANNFEQQQTKKAEPSWILDCITSSGNVFLHICCYIRLFKCLSIKFVFLDFKSILTMCILHPIHLYVLSKFPGKNILNLISL